MAKINENEIGQPGGLVQSYDWKGATYYAPESSEQTFELIWPRSVQVFDAMRRTDSQVSGILRAMFMPILAANWTLDTEGVRPQVVNLVRSEMGLSMNNAQARQRRRKQGIVWVDHLRTALLAAPYGHMPFEQVYEVSAPDKDQTDVGLKTVAHLRKLAPRFPRTLTEIHVAPDGGLLGITQEALDATAATGYEPKFIPVDRLVFYCLDREGGDWTGTSILRSAYKHWMIRDVLIRLSAQIVERNGMGVPDMVYDGELVTRQDALKAVSEYRAGATAGMVRPVGTQFSLVGVSGTTVDPLPVINFHDQAVAKSVLAMFMDLGHDTGARSLGETFVDFFTDSLQALAEQIAETATEHIIRDLVELNYGEDEPYPVLVPGNLATQNKVTAATLAALTTAKLITPDGKLESHLRDRYGLPVIDKASRPEPPAPPVVVAAPTDGQPPADGTKAPVADGAKPAAPDNVTPIKAKPGVKVTAASGVDLLARARDLMAQIEANHVPGM